MIHVKSHLSKLGLKAQDKVTGFNGVITSVSFDLYGCVTALVNPGLGEDGKLRDQSWFDIERLSIEDETPVMSLPNYEFGVQAEGKQGAEDKPLSNKA